MVTQEIIRSGNNYRTYRKCKGCGEIDLALCDAKGNFRSEYCHACTSEVTFQLWDGEFIYYKTKHSVKRLYKRTCFICGRVQYLRVNRDGYFNSPYCRSCMNTARAILRRGCPHNFAIDESNSERFECLTCKLAACYFDINDIQIGNITPHKLERVKNGKINQDKIADRTGATK